MKRSKFLLIAVLSASIIFTGCGKKAEEPSSEQGVESSETGDSAVTEVVEELDDLSQQLKPLVDSALQKGIIDQSRYDEFAHYLKRISDIKISKGSSDAVKKELSKIKDELAVLASQVSASNDVIDALVKPAEAIKTNESEQTVQETSAADNSAQVDTKGPATLRERVSKFSSDYISFQNECSRRVDLGEIAQEDYTELLNLGIRLVELKEKTDLGQVNDELENELNSLKESVHNCAVKVKSELADTFE